MRSARANRPLIRRAISFCSSSGGRLISHALMMPALRFWLISAGCFRTEPVVLTHGVVQSKRIDEE